MGHLLQMHRRTAKCVVAPQDDNGQMFLMIGAYLITGTMIAFWLAHFPNLSGYALGLTTLAPQHATEAVVNRLHKGNLISGGVQTSFDERWNALTTIRKPASSAMPTRLAAE